MCLKDIAGDAILRYVKSINNTYLVQHGKVNVPVYTKNFLNIMNNGLPDDKKIERLDPWLLRVMLRYNEINESSGLWKLLDRADMFVKEEDNKFCDFPLDFPH